MGIARFRTNTCVRQTWSYVFNHLPASNLEGANQSKRYLGHTKLADEKTEKREDGKYHAKSEGYKMGTFEKTQARDVKSKEKGEVRELNSIIFHIKAMCLEMKHSYLTSFLLGSTALLCSRSNGV